MPGAPVAVILLVSTLATSAGPPGEDRPTGQRWLLRVRLGAGRLPGQPAAARLRDRDPRAAADHGAASGAPIAPARLPQRRGTDDEEAHEDDSTGADDSRTSGGHTAITLRWENDLLAGTDEGYSSGVALTVSRDGAGPLGWVWSRIEATPRQATSSYEVSQLVFTPRDISDDVPDQRDIPYSGFLLGSVATGLAAGDSFYGLKVTGGVRGPASYAEQAQRAIHRIMRSHTPRGWSHQLPNRFIANLLYEQRRRFSLVRPGPGWGLEIIPRVAGSVGNALVEGQAGTQVRAGANLPDDFGSTETRGIGRLPFPRAREPHAARELGAYVFAGGSGHVVARNLALDDSRTGFPAVTKRPAFASARAGMVFWSRRYEFTVAYVVRGREHAMQSSPSAFGTASLAVRF